MSQLVATEFMVPHVNSVPHQENYCHPISKYNPYSNANGSYSSLAFLSIIYLLWWSLFPILNPQIKVAPFTCYNNLDFLTFLYFYFFRVIIRYYFTVWALGIILSTSETSLSSICFQSEFCSFDCEITESINSRSFFPILPLWYSVLKHATQRNIKIVFFFSPSPLCCKWWCWCHVLIRSDLVTFILQLGEQSSITEQPRLADRTQIETDFCKADEEKE